MAMGGFSECHRVHRQQGLGRQATSGVSMATITCVAAQTALYRMQAQQKWKAMSTTLARHIPTYMYR